MGIDATEEGAVGNARGHFKIHYHLRDESHQMDALVRNRCEAEALALLKEVSNLLDIPFRVETLAYGEGGLEEYLVLVGQYKDQIEVIRNVLISVFGLGGSGMFLKSKLRHSKQQTQLNDLALQKARLELKKMTREEAEEEAKNKTAELPLEPQPTADEIAEALLAKKKVKVRRSNLYRNLLAYGQVDAVGYAPGHGRTVAERRVERQEFEHFIVEPEDLEPERYTKVEIEIVSPVLRPGTLKWRGIYNKKTISFDLADQDFRAEVIDQKVQFQNGTTLVCDLEVRQRDNEAGEPEITGYAVTRVHTVSNAQKVRNVHGEQGSLPLVERAAVINEPKRQLQRPQRLVHRVDGGEEIDSGDD